MSSQLAEVPQFAPRSEAIVRELPPEEYMSLVNFRPFDEIGPPDPLRSRCVIVQEKNTGNVLGFAFISVCLHIEPLWVDPSTRKRPGVIRRMWRAIRGILEDSGQEQAFAIVNYEDMPRGILSQVTGLGFQRVPGDLFVVAPGGFPKWTEKTSVDQTVLGEVEA